MTVLGIDTSFDDTAAAVVRGTTILSNVFSSQLPLYQEWGGVVPNLARRSHEEHIDGVIALALKRAGVTWDEIDAIAVTYGPGLAIALGVGLTTAQKYAKEHHKPLIAVNHMEGHLLSFLAQPNITKSVTQAIFPALGVLVSGGHTQFVLVKAIGSYEIVGETQDDAMGEAFDKVGRMLGLGYPAGALVEKLAKAGSPGVVNFPVPMRSVKSANTSFSGLKTAAQRIIDPIKEKRGGVLTSQDIANIAYGFQVACMTHLIEKLRFAMTSLSLSQETNPRSLILGGGVAANSVLRFRLRQVAKEYGIPFFLPYTKKLCVDNAAMIALVGSLKAERHEFVSDVSELDRNPIARLGALS